MRCLLPIALILAIGIGAGLSAQTPVPPEPPGGEPFPGFPGGEFPFGVPEEEPAAMDPAKPLVDATTTEFKRAIGLQEHKKFLAAQRAFRKILDDHPDSVHKRDIEARSDDNCYAGCEVLYEGGPPKRRIDVAVMGDGFTIDDDDQRLEEKWAQLCLDVLFSEWAFDEYRSYFNYYFVRLISLEEGVDPTYSPEERAKIEAKNKLRTRKKKLDFSTALDCKAAGPQGQVVADRNLVYRWLDTAAREVPGCKDDGLIIAFARFGKLGMGGGGIANVGRPDKSVTVHEFGHSFVGLLDEYANNLAEPMHDIKAANASRSNDPEKVPWAHFLKKKVPGVGVFEGGATYKKGVYRPANGCAMNSAGNTGFCPVCREAAVLRIYAYVDPIDAFGPPTVREVRVKEGAADVLSVTPMEPKKHPLQIQWFVEVPGAAELGPDAVAEKNRDTGGGPETEPERFRRNFEARFGRFRGGRREREDRSAYDFPPEGTLSTLASFKKGDAKRPSESVFPIGRMKAGRYIVTAVVKDTTPNVLADPKHLLEERVSWWVTVNPR